MSGAELRAWRDARGWSQAALASRLHVHVQTISKWERDERAIPPFLYLALQALRDSGEDGVDLLRRERIAETS
jgi:transcriptional regulator with XRE-family HTH domain